MMKIYAIIVELRNKLFEVATNGCQLTVISAAFQWLFE